MARITKRERRKKAKREALVALLCIMRTVNIVLSLYMPRLRLNPNVYQHQIDNLNRLVRGSDTDCHNQLRVNRYTFMSLCHLLKQNGLEESRNVTLVERVAIFLWILYTIQKIGVRPFNFGDQGKQLVDISTLFCWWCYAFTMCCGIIQKLFLLMSQMLGGNGLRYR
ncbi:hypothetical protein RHMOL_Rhmol06G0251000 [Rhododendron molle]|uniref:Uncharacterized protein n=1 Tax=Rhododendron molle TaxID=49168 RepID=A0ACC0NI24_RHOML|nr:hypothetical protein RHMOL_Rhmol06G0251000 [Rhododendron molle]